MSAQHVLISGASRGLGLAISRALLDAGYVVSGFSRSASDEVEALRSSYPGRYVFGNVAVTDAAAVRGFVSEARKQLGPLYGLVNNAATAQEGILATLPEVEIASMIETNLTSSIRLARLAIRDMAARRAGRVINISSIVGSRGYNGLAVYSATKAGLDGFTRSLAREVGRRSVTVNSVGPGYMRTAMSAGLSEESLDQIVRRTPMGRLAELSDVVPLILFLLSAQAGFITGQTILVDGGISN